MVKDIADVYSITAEDLLKLERMAEKSAANIMSAIETSKERPLSRVLFALGILHVGSEMAETLTGHYRNLWSLSRATEEQLVQIPGIGPKIAESVATYFQDEANRNILRKLQTTGVQLVDDSPREPVKRSLAGMQFVVTGRLDGMTRSAGGGAHQGAWRRSWEQREPQDQLPGRRRGGRLQAGPGEQAGHSRPHGR